MKLTIIVLDPYILDDREYVTLLGGEDKPVGCMSPEEVLEYLEQKEAKIEDV